MSANREALPRIETFAVGEPKGVTVPPVPVFGAVKLDDDARRLAPLFGVIHNHGGEAFTFSVEESADDSADAYAAVDMRVGGAAVASVLVVPGGRVVFALEPADLTDNYLRFKAVSAAGTVAVRLGYLTLCSFQGEVMRWESRKA